MSASNPSVDPLLGTLVAKQYFIRHRLGEGGLGIVHAAADQTNHPSPSERTVVECRAPTGE